MKKFAKILGVIMSMTMLFGATACGEEPQISTGESVDATAPGTNCTIEYARYTGIGSTNDVDGFIGEVSTNLPVKNGIVVSPYYSMTINGEAVTVYAARTASGIHSFAVIDVAKDDAEKDFYLNVEVQAKEASEALGGYKPKVVVLPESRGVTATLEGKTVSATIKDYGSYSFAFNNKPDEALTLMIHEKEDTEALFEGYTVKYLEPGDYTRDSSKTNFNEENTVYYLKGGQYKTDTIRLGSNTILYLDRNAYIKITPPETGSSAALLASGSNVKVAGRGLMDFSACCGGEVPAPYYSNKGGLAFNSVKNASFSGITVINSQTWTLCMNACIGVHVEKCLFLAYRVYADGIMLSDCQDAIVENNFIHTGDDAFETKSTTGEGRQTKNVLFRNNAAWTDKAVAYGCIYESNYDTSDVHFENNSVGFATGTWSNHLGCCVIQMGNRKGATMSNIYFDNMEIFYTCTPGMLNVYIGGSGGRGAGYGIVKNIYFRNVTAKINYGNMLHLQTYDSENCFIYDLYLDNITANGVKLTSANLKDNIDDKFVSGGYDRTKYLHLNTLG